VPRLEENAVTELSATQTVTVTGAGYVPTHFDEVIDTAECAIDDQLEQLQRVYAAATRAAVRASIELELLELRDDIPPNVLTQARRQQAAADTRCLRLQRAIGALECRTESRTENA
jgi:hypothetical protein